jgi:histidinol-phosphatase (PHP family)
MRLQQIKANEVDYHVHSGESPDASGSIEELCERAVEIGLKEIVFTEHFDATPRDIAYMLYDYEKCRGLIDRMQEKFGDRLSVKLGIEIGYRPGQEAEIIEFLYGKEFEVVIGAIHWVGRELLCDDFVVGKTEEESHTRYFATLLPPVESGLFDVLAHLDIIKRHGTPLYGPFNVEKWMPFMEPVLRKLIQKGMALEINTSGVRQAPREPYPGLPVIKRYRELGGRLLTIGSDARGVETLAVGVDTAATLLEEAGFTEFTRFEGRKPIPTPL